MANTKISELTAVTALAGTDVFPVVDVSASTTNKVSVSDLLRNAPDGAADAPSIANAGDQDTGIFFPAANSVGVSTAGTQRLVIDSSGNVGIGTSSPSTKFVVSNSGAEGLELSHSSGTSEISSYNRSTSARAPVDIIGQTFKVLTGNPSLSTGLFQDSSGNVGIGTSSPTQKLSVNGNLQFEANDGVTIGAKESLNVNLNSSGGQSNRVFQIKDNGTARVTFEQAGNVGIGTTSPGLPLDVVANTSSETVRFRGASGNVGTLRFTSNDGATNYSFIQSRSTFFELGTDASIPLKFATAGSERARIDSSGNVGIGTSSPSVLLHVKEGTGAHANLILENSEGSAKLGTNSNVFYVESSQHIFYNSGGSTEYARIDSSGNVGINLTPSGDSKLQINGSMRFAGSGTASDSSNPIIYRVSGADHLAFASGNSERMRLDSSGRLLVGTSSATHGSAATAEFAGTNTDYIFSLTNSTASDSNGHRFSYLAFTGTQSGGEKSILASVNGAHDGTADDTKGMLVFRTNNGSEGGTIPTERARITSSGDIYVGASGQPFMYFLDTDGSLPQGLGKNGLRLSNGNSDAQIRSYASANGWDHVKFYNNTSTAETVVGRINTSTSSTSYLTTSDYRLKENVVDLDGAITRVKQLQPKRFNFIVDADTTVDGFLAHEAQTVVPEAVTGTHNEVDDDGNAVMQGIDQSKLVPLLTAALQEAIAKIETLETKVAALEAQ